MLKYEKQSRRELTAQRSKHDDVIKWKHSSNGNICRVTGHLCGELTGHRWIPLQRPVTRSFDVIFDLRLNKRFSLQSWGWWFEALPRPIWRQCNVKMMEMGWCNKKPTNNKTNRNVIKHEYFNVWSLTVLCRLPTKLLIYMCGVSSIQVGCLNKTLSTSQVSVG